MQTIFSLLSPDPLVRSLQLGLVCAGLLDIFLIAFTTRDILLRTRSFLYQFLSIVLVAGIPGLGFLLYLLIRPARTLKERELERQVQELLGRNARAGEPSNAEASEGQKKVGTAAPPL